jgi:hypothetical protein
MVIKINQDEFNELSKSIEESKLKTCLPKKSMLSKKEFKKRKDKIKQQRKSRRANRK